MRQFKTGMNIREVVTAANMNEIRDAVNWVQMQRFSEAVAKNFSSARRDGVIRIKAGTTALDAFAAVELSEPVLTPTNCDTWPWETPTFTTTVAGDTGKPWAILMEPAEPGELAQARVIGVVPAVVTIRDAAHSYVRPVANSATGELESCESSEAKILWRGGTSGAQWCVLQLGSAASAAETASHAPFKISFSGGTVSPFTLSVASGFASRNGDVVQVEAGTVSVSQSGYVMLRAPFNDSTGWGSFEYAVIPITGGTVVAITDADYPLGYVTVSGGTAVASIESFTPPLAVFIKTGSC